jgi:16S rRNA (guanine527-N7)-methyltransferase
MQCVPTASTHAARLVQAAERIQVSLSSDATERLLEVLARLATAPHNLTAIRGLEQGIERHVLDSLVVLADPGVAGDAVVADIGSGSGFPGLAVAAARPDATVYLVESVRRKADWLDHVARDLFPNVEVVNLRSEEWARHAAETCDLVLARALAPPPVALELCAPPARVGGAIVLWAGPADSLLDARTALAADLLGLAPCRVVPVEPFPTADRRLLVVEKTAATPSRYPRRPGRAASRPIA